MERTAANQNPSFAGILHLIVVLVLLIVSCVSRIICEKDAPCELEEFDPQTPTCGDANVTIPEDYASFAKELCQADCEMSDAEEDASKRCRFWRFVSWTSSTA